MWTQLDLELDIELDFEFNLELDLELNLKLDLKPDIELNIELDLVITKFTVYLLFDLPACLSCLLNFGILPKFHNNDTS